MTFETVFANAQVILPTEVITGQVLVQDGVIADIAQGSDIPFGAVDCGGDYLCPGLIELHTDNLEQHISPRPRVDWPHNAAILAHDAELAGCGISTVFDALRVGSVLSKKRRVPQICPRHGHRNSGPARCGRVADQSSVTLAGGNLF